MKIKVLTILSLFIMLLPSCKKDGGVEYEFIVTNLTNYHLDQIEFGCGKTYISTEVEANTVSAPFFIKYKAPVFPVTQPLLCIGVLKYSDTLSSYENSYGRTIPFSDLKEEEVNNVKVEINSSSRDSLDVFIISVNN